MKKFVFIILVSFIFLGCSKDDISPTKLVIRLTDAKSSLVSGATVILYKTEDDWKKNSNGFATATSDSQGEATFSKIDALTYWVDVKKSCTRNWGFNGSIISTSGSIRANETTTLTIPVKEMGQFTMVNGSSNPYEVFFNGVSAGQMIGRETKIFNAEIGTYTIRVRQISGFIAFPTDQSRSFTLTCLGNTTTVNFPN